MKQIRNQKILMKIIKIIKNAKVDVMVHLENKEIMRRIMNTLRLATGLIMRVHIRFS